MSAAKSISSGNIPNPQASIQEERAASKFDPVRMHHFLEGSEEDSILFRRLVQQMERDPILGVDSSYYELSKEDQRRIVAEKIGRLSQYLEKEDEHVFNTRLSLLSVFDPQSNTRIGINLGLFLTCIRGNGTAEQIKFWTHTKETAQIKLIYGCFGMTELAHGSNVAGLETTATLDKETDEFVINTPHIGATKWWIGGAAHSSTHCSVYARLIVDGEDYGVKTFIVPLRDANHNLMPGVTVGDIGAKMGRDGIDNGWIQFSSVRIPRFFMLQKFCKVSKDGDVVLPPLEQLSYSALLHGRVAMVKDSFRTSARFSTIALRYAIGRRQFKSQSGTGDGLETQLLNYPLHQRRLIPFLATAYLISAGAHKIGKTIETTLNTLDAAVEANDMGKIMKSIDEMKSLFIDSASLKATSTWMTADIIDQSRQSCGGHGYSAYNGFGKTYNDWVVQCTWEGDNNVLSLSVGKPIIRSISEAVNKGKKSSGSTEFITRAKDFLNDEPVLKTIADADNTELALKAIEVAIIRLGYQASKIVAANGGNYDTVGSTCVTLSKLKAHHYLIKEFVERIKTTKEKELVPYLNVIVKLYIANVVFEKFAGDFLGQNVIPNNVLNEINFEYIPKLLKEIRPNVVAYTDSFQQSDMLINAAIGRYDGNIYENYFDTVKMLNPPKKTKAPYSADFERFLGRTSTEERERFEKSAEVGKILSK